MLALTALLSLLPGQFAPVAEDALMAPMQMRVPAPGETGVARNAAFITLEQLSGASVVSFEGQSEILTPATVEVIEGLTVARLPLQPALSTITLRLDFQGGYSEDVSWTTGGELIDGPLAAPELDRAEVVRPFLENPHVEIEVAPNDRHAAAILYSVDGEQRTRVTTAVGVGVGSGIFLGDYTFTGGARDYEVVVLDRAGELSEATPTSVSEVGCASTPTSTVGGLALLLLALRRRGAARRV